jgi:hypothetical protein
MDKLKVLSTVQKMLYDVITVLSNEENDGKPFEIGCRCKDVDTQVKLHRILKAIFNDYNELNIDTREEDNVIFIERL